MGCICQKQLDNESGRSGFVEFTNYCGEKNCLGQRNGRGQYYYDNGDSYDGFWKRNKKHGYGKYTFKDGRILEGFFEGDKFIGEMLPTEIDDDDDRPLPTSTGLRSTQEPLIHKQEDKEELKRKRAEHQKKIEEMKRKYGVRDS